MPINLITGTAGNDTLTDPFDADTIKALGGNDTINIANGNFGGGETIDGGSGTDTIVLTSVTNTIDFSTGGVTAVEKLTGGTGSDIVTLFASQYVGFTAINLGNGADTLNVKVSGSVDISGASAPNLTSVENRNLIGTVGDDSITLTGAQLNAFTLINLGSGSSDAINLKSTSTGLNTLSDEALSNVEIISAAAAGGSVTIDLSRQTEAFWIPGSASADSITGGSGDDAISGGNGNDTISGGKGNDTISGDSGSDTINGGDGNDTIKGGDGNDTLTGGSGADTFVYLNVSESGNSEIITDFQHGIDKIDIAALLGATDLAWGNTTPTTNGVWFTHSNTGGKALTHVWADTNGKPGTTELHIVLNGNILLDRSDFLGIVNLMPETAVASGSGLEDALSIAISLTGSDIDGTVTSFHITSLPTGGTLYSDAALTAVIASGDIVTATAQTATVYFVPNANFSGTPSFQYASVDNRGLEDTSAATATITVNSDNDAPVLTGTPATLSQGNVNTAYTVSAVNLLKGFTDVDNDTLSVFGLTASNGVVTGNNIAGFTITPSQNYIGSVLLSYNVIDSNGGSTPATLGYVLTPNVAPARTGTAATLEDGTEDTAYTVTAAKLLTGFTDVENDTLSISDLTASNGVVTGNNIAGFTITPSANFNGAVTLNYNVIDGNGGVTPATLSYSLAAVNDAPALTGVHAILLNGTEDTPYIISKADLLAGFSDVEGDTMTATAFVIDGGDLVTNPDGSVTFTPKHNHWGLNTLRYHVTDGDALSTEATLQFTIEATPDAPTDILFDLGTGFSTDGYGGERTFDAYTTYHITIQVPQLTIPWTTLTQENNYTNWQAHPEYRWDGAENLGVDDTITFIGMQGVQAPSSKLPPNTATPQQYNAILTARLFIRPDVQGTAPSPKGKYTINRTTYQMVNISAGGLIFSQRIKQSSTFYNNIQHKNPDVAATYHTNIWQASGPLVGGIPFTYHNSGLV